MSESESWSTEGVVEKVEGLIVSRRDQPYTKMTRTFNKFIFSWLLTDNLGYFHIFWKLLFFKILFSHKINGNKIKSQYFYHCL